MVSLEPQLIEALRDILVRTQNRCGNQFSGVGVIVTDQPEALPLLPLRESSEPPAADDTVSALAAISVLGSKYHDGFHILSSDLRLKLVAQYFSPPIVTAIALDRSRLFGGRYVAALFGSALPGVQLTGIASRDFGIAIFEQGAEKLFEPSQC
jgi:hypothetical protein